MNYEAMQLWIDGLRSDEFKQGVGKLLQVEDGAAKYCCLGVACVLAKRAGVIETLPWERAGRGFEVAVLPPDVSDWLGTSEWDTNNRKNPMVKGISLAGHNDAGATFREIADMLEQVVADHKERAHV
jgi:hypothetical protein